MSAQLDAAHTALDQNSVLLRQGEVSSRAAEEAANTAAKQLEMAERPWISADLAVGGPLVFGADGAKMPVVLSITNSGRSPATRVEVTVEWFPIFLDRPDPFLRLMNVCKSVEAASSTISPEAVKNGAHYMSRIIFPGKQPSQIYVLSMDRADIQEGISGIAKHLFPGYAPKRRALQIDVLACIGYRPPFLEAQYHTGIITELFRLDSKQPRASAEISADPGEIPPGDLRMMIHPVYGTYAN